MMDLFPGVISRPVTVREAIGMDGSYTNSSFEWVRKYNAPFQTFTKTKSKSHIVFNGNGDRYLKQSELSLGGSYPIGFAFTSFEDAIQRIGNSVPPLLMRSIATQIRYTLWQGDPLTSYPRTMTYPEILEASWQDHLAPRDPNAPTFVSTFAGGGGSSLGYSMAGYQELLAVEWDNNAVATFKLNFPDVPVYHGDIHNLSVEECMRLAGLTEPGELDLLDGSPPCQGVSTAGKRDLDDPRNQLFREFVRLLRGLKPKVFVMENVPGLVKGKMKLIFAEIMRELKASGYQVKCKKLNAMYFYVPQSRERLIFIGARDDLGVEASHPKVESRSVTIEEAINIPENTLGYITASDERRALKRKRPLRKASQVAPTLCKTRGSRMMKGWEPALISKLESSRFGSFPDSFILKEDWAERIGNSVPPLFMRAIALHIKHKILTPTPQRPLAVSTSS